MHLSTIEMSLSNPPSTVRISRIRGEVEVRYARCWREVRRGRVGTGESMAVVFMARRITDGIDIVKTPDRQH